MIHEGWLLVVLTLLAVTRLTRLVTTDVVFQPFRAFVIRHRPAPPAEPAVIKGDGEKAPAQDQPPKEDWLIYLVHCPWCSSIWLAFPVAAVVYNWPCSWPVQIGLLALAASFVAGLSGRWE